MAPQTIQRVLDEELEQVETSRALRHDASAKRPEARRSLVGLAFSGGGIRSATFNLGLLQALARKRLLRSVDYISTVSGGGYIGAWLIGWMHHQGVGIKEIEERLSTPPDLPQQASDLPELHFLRDYSNYLTPRKGVLGGDFLAFLASYVRNTLLNQTILVLALLSLLLVPRTIVYLLHVLEDLEDSVRGSVTGWLQPFMQSQYYALAVGLALGFVAVVFIGLNLETVDPRTGKRDYWFAYPWAVNAFVVVPLAFSSALVAYGCSQFLMQWEIVEKPLFRAPAIGLGLYFVMWTGACIVRRVVRLKKRHKGNGGPVSGLVIFTSAITGILIGYLFVPFASLVMRKVDGAWQPQSNWHIMTFAAPTAILIMLIAGVIHIGLMGRGMSDAHREWWGRLGGILVLFAACWLGLFLISIYFPPAFRHVLSWENQRGHPVTTTGIVAWVVSTAYGVFFGKSEKTSKWNPDAPIAKKALGLAAKVTPYIFILGLLLGLSLVASYLATWAKHAGGETLRMPSDLSFDIRVPVMCAIFFLAAVIVSWRVDINEFSIHYLYRNRLVRCYLGATVPGRNAQPFTGFSEMDNFPLGSLKIPAASKDPKDGRPLPIFNMSLNAVRGKELALQTRKARSFAMTPLYGGFTRVSQDTREWEPVYARTEKLACKVPGFKDGVTVGTAVAISGAAASPNMGSYSEPALSFLMTLFDVRLGWWIGNPGGKGWENGSPTFGFSCLIDELLGATDDANDYVYLSDGGHFENLAVYELVRRRCKLIIASDASCDSGSAFGDLHNAVERCRTDFGVEITVDGLQKMKPKASADDPQVLRADSHFAVGKIRYDPRAPEEDGTIIYLKPGLVAGDPDDVLAYALKNKSFPHDTTANQWFDEAHFENYRALGVAVGNAAAETISAEMHRALS